VAHKGHHRKPDPEKVCRICGEPMVRKYLPCGKLERHQDFLTRKYCSRRCLSASITFWCFDVRKERGEPIVVLPLAEMTV
jgi:hypothetical protein